MGHKDDTLEPPPGGRLVSHAFLSGLGLVYALAFLSAAPQVLGLFGSQGLLPVAPLVTTLRERGVEPWRFPTLHWWWSSDLAVQALPWIGAALGLAVFLGARRRILLALLWGLYLSVTTAGRDFFSFQWDILLLECGFLALFLRPGDLLGTLVGRFVLFKLMFLAGYVKLASGDPAWRDLSALVYHFETQPIPNPVAWFFHHLGRFWHEAGVAFTFGVELALPFFVFGPRKARLFVFFAWTLLQVLIAVTGNYGFFNLLSIILGVFLLDDRLLVESPLGRLLGFWNDGASVPKRWAFARLALSMILLLNVLVLWEMMHAPSLPQPARVALNTLRPFYLVNRYGLFAVMTKERPEIVIEGSMDGQTWQAYEFAFKPGALDRPPPVVAPHMPRLDWQMWFAALGNLERNQWMLALAQALLEGREPVLRLLAHVPFENRPRFVRARLYDYRFATSEDRERGLWWRRELRGEYLPPVSLRPPSTP